jgi:hypothetical protein
VNPDPRAGAIEAMAYAIAETRHIAHVVVQVTPADRTTAALVLGALDAQGYEVRPKQPDIGALVKADLEGVRR